MKRILLCLGLLVILSLNAEAGETKAYTENKKNLEKPPCLTGGFTFTTQAHIDDFATNFPDCDVIDGDVFIGSPGGSTISNLNGLFQLTAINGNLFIWHNDDLVNLNGLIGLQTINGSLNITDNSSLESLFGLFNLETIEGDLNISNCDAISSTAALNSLSTLNGGIFLIDNEAFRNLHALENLSSIGGGLNFSNNPNLRSLTGLANVISMGAGIYLDNNPFLTDLSDLNNLETIDGYLFIENSPNLNSLTGLENLTTIGASLLLFNNASALSNLAPLSNVTSIGTFIRLENNAGLADISGLRNVTSIGSYVQIKDNPLLSSLSGLENIDPTTITDLTIESSMSLSTCDLPNICAYLTDGGTATISGNATGCADQTEVAAACAMHCITTSISFSNQADIDNFSTNYPNCDEIDGDVFIGATSGGSTINNLNGLSQLKAINGALRIWGNDNLLNLNGLNSLETIAGNLDVIDNPSLNSLNGLEQLQSIGGIFSINNCDALTSISSLSNLNIINDGLFLIGNELLSHLSGLNNLECLGSLRLSENPVLNSLTGLEGITSIDGTTYINDNAALTNLTGLNNVLHTDGFLWIENSPAMTSLTGIENLGNIGGSLVFKNNSSLADITALCSVTSVARYIRFENNANLTDLNSLHNITSIDGYLHISDNPLLTSLSGLDNIDPSGITDLTIQSSMSLSTCDLPNLCTYLTNGGTATISGNATGCNDQTEVAAACAMHCITTSISFSNQADIDNFSTNYPNCTEVEGSLTISGSNITDLSGLSQLTVIHGRFTIFNTDNLANLSGLENIHSLKDGFHMTGTTMIENLNPLQGLTYLGANLSLTNNSTLNDISAFSNLTKIEINILIDNNPNLSSLTGLEGITQVQGRVSIGNNPSLISLAGLANLSCVGTNVTISNNVLLENLEGLNALNHIGDYLWISGNDNLQNLSGLEGLETIERRLVISNNSNLTSIAALSQLNFFGRDLYLGDCPNLTNLTGLEQITQIHSYLTIDNLGVGDLSALANLSSIDGNVFIQNNEHLTNLTALGNLTGINGSLNIVNNSTLTQLYGLENINPESMTDLIIESSMSLSTCDLPNICAYLTDGGTATISGNATGCNDQTEVTAGCAAQCLPEGITFTSQTEIDNFATNNPSCTQIAGDITIENLNRQNSIINNLNGLSQLTDIYGDLNIINNGSLTSLSGLSNLTSVHGAIHISDNAVLTELSGLENIDPDYVDHLILQTSAMLSACSLPNICTYLDNGGSAEISGNATGCNNQVEVESSCMSLPIAFLQLRAYQVNKGIQLEWSVAEEINMFQYEIERSTDGIYFEQIGKQMAVNQRESQYVYTDRTIEFGSVYYYRLKMIEQDGRHEYSTRIFVESKNAAEAIHVFPNPSTDYLYVKGATSPNQPYKIQSMNGLTIVTSHLMEDGKIDLSGLPKGIYLLSFLLDHQVITKRIVKMD